MTKSLMDNYSKEELEWLVADSYTLTELISRLGYKCCSGRTGDTVKKRLDSYGIDYSHFNVKRPNQEERTFENSFCENSTASSTYIRRHYYSEHTKEYKCAICGLPPIWNGKDLVLTIDHINGKHNDNRLENLRWVCPNCDRQLDTFAGRNFKKKEKKKETHYCIDCNKNVVYKKGNRCYECSRKNRRVVDRPSREQLKKWIRTRSFNDIGRQFNVDGNTIKKWCKYYHLPHKKADINQYSDDEWQII